MLNAAGRQPTQALMHTTLDRSSKVINGAPSAPCQRTCGRSGRSRGGAPCPRRGRRAAPRRRRHPPRHLPAAVAAAQAAGAGLPPEGAARDGVQRLDAPLQRSCPRRVLPQLLLRLRPQPAPAAWRHEPLSEINYQGRSGKGVDQLCADRLPRVISTEGQGAPASWPCRH